MANKKTHKAIDAVKSDLRELTEAFWALRDEVLTHHATTAAEQQSRAVTGDEHAPDRMAVPDGTIGHMTVVGSYEMPDGSGGKSVVRWGLEEQPAHGVLDVAIDEAAKTLAAIGHRQRLRITIALLQQPATASDLVSRLSLGTTGAAYHHLNVLQGAGIVQQEQRGVFSIMPDRIPMLMSILSGLTGAFQTNVEAVAPDEPHAEGELTAVPD